MPPPSKNHKNDCYDNKRTLRPRYNPPSISIPNTSSDDSFMDTTGDEKNRDETYVPVAYDDNTDSSYLNDDLSASLKDMSNCTRDLTSGSISLELNTDEIHLIDQVVSNVTIGDTEHILVENSDNSIIENSDTNNISELSNYHIDMYIPAIESKESYITKKHTVTSQSMLPCQTIDASNKLEQSQYHENVLVPTIESVDPYVSKNHTVTSQSSSPGQSSNPSIRDLVPTTSTYTADNDSPSSYDSHHSDYLEIDNSDQDETYHPASTPTYSDSSNEASFKEVAGDSLINTKGISPIRCLRGDKKIYVEPMSSADYSEVISSNESGKKKKRTRTKDYCFYCETDVLNFARHIARNHTMECEVQKILSYPKKSYTRKNLLTNLRKKGNYIKNVTKCCKPMKKSSIYPDIDYLPCEKCLGFYSRKQLWKHKKRCQPLTETANTQVDAQNFMLRHLKVDKKLREDVFPKMRPDKISLEAKKDPLICAFGAQYLRIHREKHFINVTSRKMRELSKLLIELKKLKPSIKDLMDSLKPQNYDVIVTATKKVSSYNNQTDRYGAPTYAMNISTSLKQCCNIAIMATLKSDSSVKTAVIEADLKTLIHLIESNWKFDVSSQASNDLNLKKWNKVTIVSLASDLKMLKQYICEKAKSAASKLVESENSNIEAYVTLAETIYCRILLLNRRRPGELQRLLLSTYQECHNNSNAYEEFGRAISDAEKMLIKSFKRIVIRGKRGRGVPVLLTDEVQADIDLLISIRQKYISNKNQFLFAKPGSENTLCGYKVLEKYANASGAKNPTAITTTKLRKHLATLTQMFNMKETDIEQLANFMGHTQAVHRQNYRLPDDVYQTAKLSKLLLLMESGDADYYKGKSLDDIDLDLEQDLLQDTHEDIDQNDEIMEYEAVMPTENLNEPIIDANVHDSTLKTPQLCDITNSTENKTKKKRNLIPWTAQQKNIVTKFFSKHIKSQVPPKRHECEELRDLHPDIMHNKDWLKIKVFVQNAYTKGKK
ncbi:unnamed protein product [Diatraea saccharalis]|uniref:Uncharacterized protein n=1 Tax=Diatraea saccharalis TaxID=40085 RepID=A0A9N9R2I3_9NEOP|nr:unnamed protein product [Diatraea saccharalis]